MNLLEWRAAGRSDRSAIDVFTCTREPTKSFATQWRPQHPRWWEWEVQSAIRGLEPPYTYPKQMLVGLDDHGIGAVSFYEELDGPGAVELSLMAVATRLRNQGGGYADEMFRVTLEEIEARAIQTGVPEVSLAGRVWHENHASQRMIRQHGFAHTGHAADGVQVWTAVMLAGGAEGLGT